MIRNIIVGMMAALAALSCQKTAEPAPAVEVSFTACTEQTSPDTKTTFGSLVEGKRTVYWSSSDAVGSVVDYGSTVKAARVTPTPDGKGASFTVTVPDSGPFTLQAVAPRSALKGQNAEAKTLELTIPASQTPVNGSPDAKGQVLVAEVSLTEVPSGTVDLTFHHASAYGCMTLTNLPTTSTISSIELTSSVPFVGDWTYSPASRTLMPKEVKTTLTLTGGRTQEVFFGAAPVDMSGATLEVKLNTANGAYTKNMTFGEGCTFKSGVVSRFTVDMTGSTEPVHKGISILAIGNSFSVDAMEYLYGILKAAGVDEIVLGNLYIGGCTLEKHAENFTSNNGAYTYYKNTSGSWTSTSSYKPLSALAEREWDYITMQQASGSSGVAATYDPYLGQLLAIVKAKCPKSKLLWHMTWAYQQNSTHAEFPKYNSDQMTMYNAIVSAVQTQVLPTASFTGVIPCGTAVQNLRTSFIGDTVTRDGFHMSYDIGRYVTGLMWARVLTGESIAGNTYRPSGYSYSSQTVAALEDAVEKAFAKPYEVTTSAYPPEPYVVSEDLWNILKGAGYDAAKFKPLELTITNKAFYNSTGNSTMQCAATGSTASNLNQFAATQIFAKSQIPTGSVIVQKSGFQYRPEGWTSLSTKNTSSTRPANVTAQVVEVNATWWASWNYRAFNLAKAGNPALDDEGQKELLSCFAIFVPKEPAGEATTVEAVLAAEGYNVAQYTPLALTYTKNAYWNSTATSSPGGATLVCAANGSSASNLSQFVATGKIPKSQIPNGSLIVVVNGYQYRPEGWQTEDGRNTSARPGNVTSRLVVVDDAWWGDFNWRAFNLAKAGNPSLTSAQMDEVIVHFAIFIPNAQ